MKITVIGAGNGGQAIAGFCAIKGHEVRLFDIDSEKVNELRLLGNIKLRGKIKGSGVITLITNDIKKAVKDAELIFIVTTANAHKTLAKQLAPLIQEGQIIILSPGRTCGALEFRQTVIEQGCTRHFYLAEAQTLVYACRLIKNGEVNIIGIKDEVLLSALPSSDTSHILHIVRPIYGCFTPAKNVLQTSLENIGAIFHPCVLLFNAATIERKSDFYFYRDMTPQIAHFIEAFDAERLAVGKAYGIQLIGVSDWISYAYKGTTGDTLCEKMRNNPAYYDIKAPSSIYTRQLMEDIPTGVLPIMELGKAAGLSMCLFESMINICSSLLNINFTKDGRTLISLGLNELNKEEILSSIQ